MAAAQSLAEGIRRDTRKNDVKASVKKSHDRLAIGKGCEQQREGFSPIDPNIYKKDISAL